MLIGSVRGAIAAAFTPTSTQAPVARMASAFMASNATDVRIPVLLNVLDPDTPVEQLSVVSVTQGNAGAFSATLSGRYVIFTRESAGTGLVVGTYTVRDADAAEDTDFLSVTLTNGSATRFADGTEWTDGTDWTS